LINKCKVRGRRPSRNFTELSSLIGSANLFPHSRLPGFSAPICSLDEVALSLNPCGHLGNGTTEFSACPFAPVYRPVFNLIVLVQSLGNQSQSIARMADRPFSVRGVNIPPASYHPPRKRFVSPYSGYGPSTSPKLRCWLTVAKGVGMGLPLRTRLFTFPSVSPIA